MSELNLEIAWQYVANICRAYKEKCRELRDAAKERGDHDAAKEWTADMAEFACMEADALYNAKGAAELEVVR